MAAQSARWLSDPALSAATGPDNKRGAIEALLALNKYYRENPWPTPFDATAHRLHLGDARDFILDTGRERPPRGDVSPLLDIERIPTAQGANGGHRGLWSLS